MIIELTESRSEVVFEALPIDDPQVRQPDITRAKRLLGWEPQIDLREGLIETIEQQAGVLSGDDSKTPADLSRLQPTVAADLSNGNPDPASGPSIAGCVDD